MSEPLLRVDDLHVHFQTDDGPVRAVNGVSFAVERGRTLGIVGESGSGKTAAALTLMGLSRFDGASVSGRVLLDGVDLLRRTEGEMRRVRGGRIAMAFQDPLSSLHPLIQVRHQVAEAVRAHESMSSAGARARADELLALVGLEGRGTSHPHELSGGMRQRAMIATALAGGPDLLIADEPTTALDVTVQVEILELIRRLQREREMAVVLISHDLGVVAAAADKVAVMYAGRIVEIAPTGALFSEPQHPYTWGLLGSMPTLDGSPRGALRPIPGRPPSPLDLPPGCAFHPRCPYVRDRHRREVPVLARANGDPAHRVACMLPPSTRSRLWTELRAGDGDAPPRVEGEGRRGGGRVRRRADGDPGRHPSSGPAVGRERG